MLDQGYEVSVWSGTTYEMFFITSAPDSPGGQLWTNVIQGTANQIKGDGTFFGIKGVIEVGH